MHGVGISWLFIWDQPLRLIAVVIFPLSTKYTPFCSWPAIGEGFPLWHREIANVRRFIRGYLIIFARLHCRLLYRATTPRAHWKWPRMLLGCQCGPSHCLCLSCMQRLCLLFRLSIPVISEASGIVNILAAKLLSCRGAFCFILGELYSIGIGLTAEHSVFCSGFFLPEYAVQSGMMWKVVYCNWGDFDFIV